MKQRVYRGKCPYESLFKVELEGNCRNCEKFYECRKKERKRQQRVRKQRERMIALLVLVASTIGLVATAVILIRSLVFAMPQEDSSETSETTTSVSIDDMQVQVTTSVSPTATPEIYVDVDVDVSVGFSAPTEPIESHVLVMEPVISAYEPGTVYFYELSYEDKVYIAKVVYAESRGEPYEGQVAVAAVILNRFFSNDGRFNRESIYSVVTQSGQFAPIAGVTMEDLNSVASCMQAVEDACKGWDPTRVHFPNGALFFYNPDGDLSEDARIAREGIDTYRIGNHLFHIELN